MVPRRTAGVAMYGYPPWYLALALYFAPGSGFSEFFPNETAVRGAKMGRVMYK